MAGLQEYKCPCCGGAIAFDSRLQKMKCPYCESEFEMESLAHLDDQLAADSPDHLNWNTSAGSSWNAQETAGMSTFICQSCAAEIVADANTAATSCPYCGNPVVMMGRFQGALKPDLVIPFQLDKEAAKAGLRKHMQGKRLLPKIFKDENHIDEIKGVYVPFWIFDADADADIRYTATQVRTWSDSRFNYTDTSYFRVLRSGSLSFRAVPVDGSTKMPDDLMESIEPFNMNGAMQFHTAFLAGYLADKYDVDAKQSVERANQRIKKSTENSFSNTVKGYTTVKAEASSVRLKGNRAQYGLFPVWLLNTTWNGNKYTFAMNGQTGKFVGDLPVDNAAANRLTAAITAIGTAALTAMFWLFWLL